MGDTAKNINWNPGDSSASRAIMGQSGGIKGADWNPLNSTTGQVAQGNYGALRGPLQNSVNFTKDLLGGIAAPLSGIQDLGASAAGIPQAAARHEKDLASAQVQGAQEQAYGQQQQGLAQQQQATDAAQQATNDANALYQKNQAGLTDTLNSENAFNAARNAARKAKGNTLYGAWNG